jgi:predicted MFS family arabinose efflux permease
MSIERGVALFDGARRTATLLGAPLAGGLITVIGATNVVAIDAGSFLAAAGLLALLVPASAGITTSTGLTASTGPTASAGIDPERARYRTQLREGVGYVLRDRLLRSIAGMVLFTNLADAALSGLLLILWAQQRFGSTLRLGVVVAALGAGAVCGAALVAAIGSRLPRRWTFAVAFLIAGAPRFVVLALPAPFWLVLTVWAVSGFAAGAINPLLGAAQYDLVPRRLQARVFSGVGGIAWAGIPFGALLAGVAVGAAGLTATLIGGAVLYALATLDPFLRPAWSGMNRVAAG